jgi:tRNA threonylcarbamoyladenosine biosynthesis protein TsaE
MYWVVLALTMSVISSFRTPIRRCSTLPYSRGVDMSLLASSTSGRSFHNHTFSITCMTPEEVETFGSKVSSVSGSSGVILLRGDLGAGKTTFTRGLIRAKFDDDEMRVTSPSYLLDNTYEYDDGKFIHHMDLYRLPTGCDLTILGIPEIYESSLCIIEWPQRMGNNLPTEYLDIEINIDKNETRNVKVVAIGDSWAEKIKRI